MLQFIGDILVIGKFPGKFYRGQVSSLDSTRHVPLLNLNFADPHPRHKEEAEAYETQAIGCAYRQGQTKDVTIKDSVEHKLYISKCANDKGML